MSYSLVIPHAVNFETPLMFLMSCGPLMLLDREVFRLCSHCEFTMQSYVFWSWFVERLCSLQGFYVSLHILWSTEHYSTCNYSAVWSCPSKTSARASILGFPPFHSLMFGYNARLVLRDQTWFQSKVCKSVFLFILLYSSQCLTVWVCLWTPLLSLTNEATVILPVVLVWSVEDQAAVCTVGLRTREHEPQTCRSNATGRAKASNWQEAQLNEKLNFTVNHIRSHTSAKSKHFMEEENKGYLFVFFPS